MDVVLRNWFFPWILEQYVCGIHISNPWICTHPFLVSRLFGCLPRPWPITLISMKSFVIVNATNFWSVLNNTGKYFFNARWWRTDWCFFKIIHILKSVFSDWELHSLIFKLRMSKINSWMVIRYLLYVAFSLGK